MNLLPAATGEIPEEPLSRSSTTRTRRTGWRGCMSLPQALPGTET